MFTPATPKIFQTKNKAVNTHVHDLHSPVANKDFVHKSKHYPPYIKEWCNSIYAFNKHTATLLPSSEKNLFKLLKSYFSIYSLKLDKITGSKRLRIRNKRLTTNRLITSTPDFKHTNDRVNIVAYTYNRREKYYSSKINKIASLDSLKRKVEFENSIKTLKENNLKLKLKINKRINIITKKAVNNHGTLRDLYGIYLNNYVKKCMQKEIVSLHHRQSISLEQSKYEKQYLLPLVGLFERICCKKVVLNIVNLKYFYNSSDIFSNALVTKLRNKKNKPTNVLRKSLNIFNLPPIDRINLYNEMHNKKKLIQNPYVKDTILHNYNTATNLPSDSDILDRSLFNYKHTHIYNVPILKMSAINLGETIKTLKHKFTCGIRIEVAGRLTRRNTAARSVFKLRYKGNIKNIDSSYKKLSTVLLRGFAKSSLLYTQHKSKLRIGAFGLKTWVNSY